MLRASTTTARLSNAGVLPVLHDDAAATAVTASSAGATATAGEIGGADAPAPTDDDEAARLNATYLWLLVLAATAECVTTCVWPQWRGLRVNVGATALNIVGPFLDGLSYGVEALPKRGAPSVACLQFRSAFLGCVGVLGRMWAFAAVLTLPSTVWTACSRRSRSWWTTRATSVRAVPCSGRCTSAAP